MPRKSHTTPDNGALPQSPTVLIASLSSPMQIVFPESKLPIGFALQQDHIEKFVRAIERMPFLILVPRRGNKYFEIGVLGLVSNVTATETMVQFTFRGLTRVKFKEHKRIDELEYAYWFPRVDIPLTPKEVVAPEFPALLGNLTKNFKRVLEAVEPNESDVESFLEKKFVRDAIRYCEKLTSENIGAAIDSVMNVINQIIFTTNSGKDIDLSVPSLVILREQDVHQRLLGAIYVLDALVNSITEKETPDDDDEKTEIKIQNGAKKSEPEENTALSDASTLARHGLLQTQLQKPLSIPTRTIRPHADAAPPDSLIILDWKKESQHTSEIMQFFDYYIQEQARAKRHIARKLLRIRLGLTDPRRPMIGGFFPGPTGVGKTEIIRTAAQFLFGNPEAYTHISCNMIQHEHEPAYLIGSPPGYIGHDQEPILSQWQIDRFHFLHQMRLEHQKDIERIEHDLVLLRQQYLTIEDEKQKEEVKKRIHELDTQYRQLLGRAGYRPGQYSSVIDFDEVEKMHPAGYNILLRMLEDGKLDLMNGTSTDFRNSIIFFTSNIYGDAIYKEISGEGIIGFTGSKSPETLKQEFEGRIWKQTLAAVERFYRFNTAFLGRVGKENIVVFHPLSEHGLMTMLDHNYFEDFLKILQERAGIEDVYLTTAAKRFLVRESQDSTNRAIGARALRRVFEHQVEERIINLLDLGEDGGLV